MPYCLSVLLLIWGKTVTPGIEGRSQQYSDVISGCCQESVKWEGCWWMVEALTSRTPASQLGWGPPSCEGGRKWKWSCSVVSDSVTPWAVAYHSPPSMEFSRQEYWNGLPFPSPGDLPNPGVKPRSPASGRCFTIWASREARGRQREGEMKMNPNC